MARSLVLNATFEPLCVVPSRRALVLVLAEKAETVHGTGRLVHSERLQVEEPSVVRLQRFVRVPFPRRRSLNRRAVFVRDDHKCQYCGAPADSLDHVVPRSRGGDHSWENVVAACSRCNTHKRDRLLHETSMRLVRQPRVPKTTTWFLLGDRVVPDCWTPYLDPAIARSA
jgi:5-methylcytosine-specific restriction endonuclease McrA